MNNEDQDCAKSFSAASIFQSLEYSGWRALGLEDLWAYRELLRSRCERPMNRCCTTTDLG